MIRILVIEDDEALRDNIVLMLDFWGYDVQSTTNGKDGFQKALSFPPDLILCEQRIGDADDFQLATALRNDRKTSLIPVVFITPYVSAEALEDGIVIGSDDYLFKPVQIVDLLRTSLHNRSLFANSASWSVFLK